MTTTPPAERSTDHATFIIERTYAHRPEHVFAAFADLDTKVRWFGDSDAVSNGSQALDFREGGTERLHMTLPDGSAMTYDARYLDIVDNARMVYAYDMTMGGQRISATIASMELQPVDGGTRLVLTEHGIYLDGLDKPSQREDGTEQLLDRLGAALDAVAAER
ncbi:MAG: hypothetical protein JWL76_488 [Thermoleophilia bacterium]|nr:hypothetical protein [Thermoleophilia bacterium]